MKETQIKKIHKVHDIKTTKHKIKLFYARLQCSLLSTLSVQPLKW